MTSKKPPYPLARPVIAIRSLLLDLGIIHALNRLISLLRLRVHPSIAHNTLLLLLHQLTATTEAGRQAISARVALHPIFLLHVASSNALQNASDTEVEETAVSNTLHSQ
jgi:hypothetical protein